MIGTDQGMERDGDALHALLRYDSQESLCARAVPYVREGLDRGEAVIAVVSTGVEQVLRSALGDDAGQVRWQAGDVSYGRLGAMFEGFRRFLAEQRAAGVPMRLLAQNDALGTEERMAAYLRFEAMANEAYRPYGYRWAWSARCTPGCSNPGAERSATPTTSSPAPTSPGPDRRLRHRLRCSSTCR